MKALPDADQCLQRRELRLLRRPLEAIEELILPPYLLLPEGLSRRDERWRIFHALAHYELHVGNQYWMLQHGYEHWVMKQERQAEEWVSRHLINDADLIGAISEGADYAELADLFDVPIPGVRLAIELLGR